MVERDRQRWEDDWAAVRRAERRQQERRRLRRQRLLAAVRSRSSWPPGAYGVPVKNFCYPAGRFDESVAAAVEAAGYAGATTEVPGFASRDAPYEMARIEVLGDWGVKGLAEAMRAGAEAAAAGRARGFANPPGG